MKLSPRSIPYRAARRASSVVVLAAFVAGADSGRFGGRFGGLLLGIGIAAAGLAGAVAYELAYYARFEYELSADTLDVRSGVVSRREREIPYRRIQNVDVSRNAIQRLLGIAAVDVETAGGRSTEGSIRYVSVAAAERLRVEIRRRKGGDGEAPDGTAPAAEELYAITSRELALVGAFSFDARIVGAATVLASGSVPFLSPLVPRPAALLLTAGGLAVVAALAVGAWLLGIAVAVVNYYGFRLTRADDELRYERGLVRRYSGSIPLGKVQTVTVEDNPLQRAFGYASLVVETAGYAPGQDGDGGSQAAVPIASRARVLDLADEIEPFDEPALERPPNRVRRRYAVRYLLAIGGLVAAAYAVDRHVAVDLPWYGPAVLLPLVPVAAHYAWKHRGYWLGPDHAVTRNGFWTRSLAVVPYYRVQTVIDSRTVFQRRWDLATVIVDTAGSRSLVGDDAAAVDVDAADAGALREDLHDRLQAALDERRRERSPFEWVGDEPPDPDPSSS